MSEKCFCHIKDKKTGEIFVVKDREARTQIESVKTRIENLENKSLSFVTDTDVGYTKDVPENALPYALISKIGGMTYKVDNTLRDAKVTKVKSVWVNKWSGEISNKTTPTIYSFENGTLKLTRNGGAIQGCVWSKEKYKAGTYTVSFNLLGVSGANFGLCTIKETSATSTGSSIKVWYTNGKQTYTFTLAEDRYIGFYTDGSGVTITASNLIINEGNTALPYSPYTEHTLAIPESVQSLEGYGQSNPDNANEYNYIDLVSKKFIAYGKISNGVWVSYGVGQDTDISGLIKDDNLIGVEGGGTLTFENEYGYDVASTVYYQLEGVAE